MSSLPVNKARVIEVSGLGEFIVYGSPAYTIIELPNSDPKLWGWIIVSEEVLAKTTPENIGKFNAVYRFKDGKPVAKLLIKDRDMAEDICFACNRLK